MPNSADYDFRYCKYCGEQAAEPVYELGQGLRVQVCRRCDFHFLNRLDIPTEDEFNHELSQAGRNYLNSRLDEGLPFLEERLALVKQQLKLNAASCLDIGAGVGQFLLVLQQAGAQGIGIEPSRARRKYAREKFDLDLRPELVGDAYWQTNYSGAFDLITLWDVIEHVNFPVETLQQATRLLKPGGWLFIETPSRRALSYRVSQLAARCSGGQLSLFLASFYSADPYGHKQIFTPSQLRQLLTKFDLQVPVYRRSYASPLLRRDKIIVGCRKPG